MSKAMFKRIDTVFLPVKDLDAAIDWYGKALGFGLLWKQANYAALKAGETPLTLYQPEGGFRPYQDHAPFNFFAPDVEAAHRHLAKMGAKVRDIQDPGGVRFFDFEDRDGNLLSVCSFDEG